MGTHYHPTPKKKGRSKLNDHANRFDNSGQRMSFPTWQSNTANIARTNQIIQSIANEFGPQYQTVAAIQPLNECVPILVYCTALTLARPAGFDGSAVLNAVHTYWLSSYNAIRGSSANTLQLIHDAFQPLSYWNGWEQPSNYQGVAMDTHIYQMFSNAVSPSGFLRALPATLLTYWLGRRAVQFPAHIYRVRQCRQPPGLRCEPAVDHRRGVDPANDGLRQVSQRAWCRRTVRRDPLGLATRRQLRGTDRVRLVVQFELQDVPPADVGSPGERFYAVIGRCTHALTGGHTVRRS